MDLGRVFEYKICSKNDTTRIISAYNSKNRDDTFCFDTLKLDKVFYLSFFENDDKKNCYVSLLIKRDAFLDDISIDSGMRFSQIINEYKNRLFRFGYQEDDIIDSIEDAFEAAKPNVLGEVLFFESPIKFRAQELKNFNERGKIMPYYIVGALIEEFDFSNLK